VPSIPFDRFRAELLGLYQPPQRARATWTKMRQVLAEVSGLGVRSTRELSPPLVVRFSNSRPGRNPSTVNGLLSYLRAACAYAVAMRYLSVNPFGVRRFWVDSDADDLPGPGGRHHPAAAIVRVLRLLESEAGDGSWAAGRLHALVATAALTGMRRGEVLGLAVGDVDLPGRLIRVRPNRRRRLKTKKSARLVPVAEQLAEVLSRWLPRTGCQWVFPGQTRSGPWLGGGPGLKALDQVKAAGLRAGVDGLTFLSLRHSWGTHAESLWGLSGPTIQRVMGHTTERTSLDFYRHPDGDNLRLVGRSIRLEAC